MHESKNSPNSIRGRLDWYDDVAVDGIVSAPSLPIEPPGANMLDFPHKLFPNPPVWYVQIHLTALSDVLFHSLS